MRSEELGRGHAERLMPLLEELLSQVQVEWNEFKSILCTTGPGSFTGLRVGLATARGLALALKCPCHGVSVFEAFAYSHAQPIAVVLDAKRDQLWLQLFGADAKPAGKPLVISVEDAGGCIPAEYQHLIGSGAPLVSQNQRQFTILSTAASPPIEAVGYCALSPTFLPKPAKPLYLRAPDAKPQKPRLVRK